MPALTTEELARRKVGSAEESPTKNDSGWYVYKDEFGQVVDSQLILNHPKFGSAQADAFVRVGYVHDRPASTEEIQNYRATLVDAGDSQTHSSHNTSEETVSKAEFDALKARLDAVESKNAEVAPIDVVIEDEVKPVTYPDKPMGQWNRDLLVAKATEMGIEVPDTATKADILESIDQKSN